MINPKSQFGKNVEALNYVAKPMRPNNQDYFTMPRTKDTAKYDNIVKKLLLSTLSNNLASFIANIVYEVPVEYCPNPNIADNFNLNMIVEITKELIESNIAIGIFENTKNKVTIYPSDSSNINLERIPTYQRLKYFFAQIKDCKEINIVYTTNSAFDKLLIQLLLSLNKNIKIINKKSSVQLAMKSPSQRITINDSNCISQNYEDFPF